MTGFGGDVQAAGKSVIISIYYRILVLVQYSASVNKNEVI